MQKQVLKRMEMLPASRSTSARVFFICFGTAPNNSRCKKLLKRTKTTDAQPRLHEQKRAAEMQSHGPEPKT